MPAQKLRLNKFLAERLGVSRREADELISAGKITVNGEVVSLGFSLPTPENLDIFPKVCYNGKIVPLEADFLYLAFNKPVGYVCSRRAQGNAPTLYDLLPKKYHQLKTVGRLDKDSSGLILLTNDGDFAFQMTHPKFRKTKVYEVELDLPLAPLHQQMISDFGVEIGDGVSKFKIIKNDFSAPASSIDPSASFETSASLKTSTSPEPSESSDSSTPSAASYTVILHEGRNRQIRRTFAALGYTVVKLHRTQFGKYELGDLEPGKCVIIRP